MLCLFLPFKYSMMPGVNLFERVVLVLNKATLKEKDEIIKAQDAHIESLENSASASCRKNIEPVNHFV